MTKETLTTGFVRNVCLQCTETHCRQLIAYFVRLLTEIVTLIVTSKGPVLLHWQMQGGYKTLKNLAVRRITRVSF